MSVRSPRGLRVIPCLIAVSLLGLPVSARYGGGSGAPADPYRIATAAHLTALGEDPNDYDKHFILTADIDLDPNLDGGKVFDKAVIAPSDTDPNNEYSEFQGHLFRGTFDGSGHTISHLTIEGGSFLGLFGQLAAGACVENLGVVDVNITGSGCRVGALIGSNGYFYARLPGGDVTCCYSTGVVRGLSQVGGLVGFHGGWSDPRGSMTRCYSTSTVRGDDSAGGLIGLNNGRLSGCYATGHVTAEHDANAMGGLVGVGFGSSDSYSLAPADGGGPDNGLGIVLTDAQMRQQSSFEGWDFYGSDADGMEDTWFMPPGSYPVLSWQEITGLRAVPDVAGLTIEQARSRLEAVGLVMGDIEYVHTRGITQAGIVDTEPSASRYAPAGSAVAIVFDAGPYDWGQNPGDGSEANPYQIQTADHLDSLAIHPELWDKAFVLTADVNMQGATYPGPVIAASFAGKFNGNGHKITNLAIGVSSTVGGPDRPGPGVVASSVAPLGAFGVLGADATVIDLTLENVRLSCYRGYSAGILAGENQGTIGDCSASGSITGASVAGGLVAHNQGAIANCRTSVSVSASQGGGLVGANYEYYERYTEDPWGMPRQENGYSGGIITRCYSTGAVTPKPGSVYVPGNPPVQRQLGGLVGSNSIQWQKGKCSGTVSSNSYFLEPPDGSGPVNGLGTPLTSTEMRQRDSFSDWDFYGSPSDGAADSWSMPEGSYPVLSWQTELTGLRTIPDITGMVREQAEVILAEAGFIPGGIRYD